jgi:ribosomal protein S1
MFHVSELAHGYVKTPNEIVKEGDEVEAKVLDVNRKKKQIKLSMKALEAQVEEFKPAKKESKKTVKRGPKKNQDEVVEQEEEKEPELTAMQIAWQEALNKSNADNKSFKMKRVKSGTSQEQEDLLDRTLKKRLPTGG